MRKTDISRYSGAPVPNGHHPSSGVTVGKVFGTIFSTIFKIIGTVVLVVLFTGIIVGVSVLMNIFKMSENTVDVDLHTLSLDLTSFIYVNDANGNPVEYQSVYAGESRIWVDFDDIPEAMKNAMIAIEDKRFKEHEGVDWIRTGGAILNLATGGGDGAAGGGSTLTQQLIKNLTNRNEVSLNRKITEIFSALDFEKKYSKDEILEAYLNVVNFGSGTNGVQAAANLYFNKDIQECTIAECAAIAAIPNNPVWYTPLIYPENNKRRQQDVLDQMYEQEMITKAEYDQAIRESEHMTFVGYTKDNVVDNVPIDDWYIEAMLNDVAEDLAAAMNIDVDNAMYMVMHGGYKIYSAMDTRAQRIAEEVLNNPELMPEDKDIQFGYVLMDYDGRVLASVGQRGEKEANQLWDFTTSTDRLPASSFKPLGAYAPAIDKGLLHYGSLVLDQPMRDIPGTEGEWPPNWYAGYKGQMPLEKALEISSNAAAAQTVNLIGLENSFDFVTNTLHLSLTQPEDLTFSAMATGAGYHGVSVREMTAAFQIFGNGGVYNKPYLYYYVEDSKGNVVLDNRNKEGEQAIKSTTATIMRYLLQNVVTGYEGTGGMAQVPGWTTYGKTGTTDLNEYNWFVGGTPYAVAGLWCGYETPAPIGSDTNYSKTVWRDIMARYLEDKNPERVFEDDPNVVTRAYCRQTGKLAGEKCAGADVDIGYFDINNLPPQYCDGVHPNSSSSNLSSGQISSIPSSQIPSEIPSSLPPSSIPSSAPSSSAPVASEPVVSQPSSAPPPDTSSQTPSSSAPASSQEPSVSQTTPSSEASTSSSGLPVSSGTAPPEVSSSQAASSQATSSQDASHAAP